MRCTLTSGSAVLDFSSQVTRFLTIEGSFPAGEQAGPIPTSFRFRALSACGAGT